MPGKQLGFFKCANSKRNAPKFENDLNGRLLEQRLKPRKYLQKRRSEAPYQPINYIILYLFIYLAILERVKLEILLQSLLINRTWLLRLFYFVCSSIVNDLFRFFFLQLFKNNAISFVLKNVVHFPSISFVFSVNDRCSKIVRFVKLFV